MIRILTVAAVAALVAAPAVAQPSIRVSTSGKTPDQVKAEVVKAASRLCSVETSGSSFPIDAQRACVAHTVSLTLAQAARSSQQLAQR